MTEWLWLGLGAAAAAPIWIGVDRLLTRRVWTTARRLSRRAKGFEHLAEIGQLVGGLAHEIKNPLSTINLNLKLLAEDLARRQDDEHARLVRRIHNVQAESDRLKDILDDFLRFAGKYELTLEHVDLRRAIEELVDFFSPQAEAARVVIRVSLPEAPVRCRLDVNLIKQAILNLMINAVHAMPTGGEMLIRLNQTRKGAVVEVIDTGSGIAPEALDKIFQAYFSTKKHGTGLGLPTTRRIIHEHHGLIQVESEVGKGTRFLITLPCDKGD